MSTSMDHDLVNLVIHGSNGQQQVIKIMRNPNGQPLTQEGVKAIVKEYMNNSNSSDVFQTKYGGGGASNGTLSSDVASSASNANVTVVASSTSAPASVAATTTSVPTTYQNPAPAHISTRSSTTSAAATSSSSASKLNITVPAPMMLKTVGKQSTSKMQSHGAGSGSSTSFAGTNAPMPTAPKKTRRRKTDRVGKGLRHFSMKVCEKVKEKGTTTYNEVADELVEEFCSQEARGQPVDPASFDQKNIRRRVYDALNVLMAMNIISKDKKEIRWIGLPTNSAQQCSSLEKENQKRKERIEAKQQQLRELILQQVSFKSLVTRNKESEERGIVPSPSSAIQMPFIIVNTHKKTHVNCSISNDKSEYQFKFDNSFEIHDDIEVLKRMGLLLGLDTGDCTYEDIERAKTMVPKAFEKYIEIYGRGQEDLTYDDADMYNEDAIIMKTEQMSDEEELDDDHYSDSDME